MTLPPNSPRASILLGLITSLVMTTAGLKLAKGHDGDTSRPALRDFTSYVRVDEQDPEHPVVEMSFPSSSVINGKTMILRDDDLKQLRQFPKLRSLQLSGPEIGNAGVAHLRHLPELELLILQHTAITDDGLAFLEKLKHLKSLVLWDNNTGDGALAHIAALRRLESLNLGKTKVTDAGIAHLQHSTQLRVLLLSNTNITDRGLESIAHLRQLEQLHLDGTQVRGPGLGSLTCSNLSTLFLHGCPIDDEGLKHLKRFPNLQSLTLADTKVKGEGLVHLADHEHLTSLQLGDLQGLVESAPSIRDAGGLPHVNSLSVVDGRLDAETVDALRVFPKLAYLNFSRTTFTDSGLERLTSFSIRGLSVFDAAVSDEQVKHLAKLKTLESLDLLGARISVEGTEQLERKLPNARIVPSSVELRVLNQVNAIGKDRNAKSQ